MRIEFPLKTVKSSLGLLADPSFEIPVKARAGFIPLEFILDTGADVTMLPASWAEVFGISLADASKVQVTGIEGRGIPAWLDKITVRIGEAEIVLPCLFSSNEDTPYVLGRLGLFDRFNITFDNRQKKIVLESIG